MPNADRIRQAFDAVEAGERTAFRELYDHDVELWAPAGHLLEGGVYRGVAAVDGWYASTLSTWTDFRFGLADLIEREPYVVALGNWTARGKSSGVPVSGRWLTVYGFRDGRVVTVAHHWGEEAGLPPPGA